MNPLEVAWEKRRKIIQAEPLCPVRVFHGPSEGQGEFASLMIDKFGDHYWITEREKKKSAGFECSEPVSAFLKQKAAVSAVWLIRPEKGETPDPAVFLGEPPEEGCKVTENGIRFRVKFLASKHPGLFLDHAPLRFWLAQNLKGKRVLNTFSYTGSLSLAAAKAGASEVMSLDLSRPAIQWAQENWNLNPDLSSRALWRVGDYFEELPKLKRQGEKFDCVILDPPSFSRGKKKVFSTSKDLQVLHELALAVLNRGGLLVTSINSIQVSKAEYLKEVESAAKKAGTRLKRLYEIELPASVPVRAGHPDDAYLKGWVFQAGS